jgi:hypothetical protein
MFGGLLDQFCPNCMCSVTGDAFRIGDSFIYNPNHTSLQLHTIIYYAVTRLHNYNPYAFVTTVTSPLLHVYTVYVHYTLILTALQHTKSPTTIT